MIFMGWYSWYESWFPECEPLLLLLPPEANFKELINLTVRSCWNFLFAKRGFIASLIFHLLGAMVGKKISDALWQTPWLFCMLLGFVDFYFGCGKIITNWMGLCTGVWKWTLGSVVHDWQISSNWVNVKVKTNKWWRWESPGVVSVSNHIKGCSVVKCFRGTMWN